MSDDASPFKGRRPEHARRAERVLWSLRKGDRVAEARTRRHPMGHELVFYVDDQLLWSQAFKDGDGAKLGSVAETKRREFEERGWRE